MATRRARKRARAAGPASPRERPAPPPETGHPRAPQARTTSRDDRRPPAPWGRLPLTEGAILVGIVVAAIGLIAGAPRAMGGGIVLVGAAAGELAVREHFAGYRSHTVLLAGLTGVVVLTLLVVGLREVVPGLPIAVPLVVAAGAFGGAFVALRRAFRTRAGVSVRV